MVTKVKNDCQERNSISLPLQDAIVTLIVLIDNSYLSSREICVRNNITIVSFEFLAYPAYRDVNRGFLEITESNVRNILYIDSNGLPVLIHDLCAWTQFHFDLLFTIEFMV